MKLAGRYKRPVQHQRTEPGSLRIYRQYKTSCK